MSLKRTIYHFAGKDYEHNQVVQFTFDVQRVSVENFLKLLKNRYVRSYTVSREYKTDYQRTNTDGLMKTVTVKCFADKLCDVLLDLGMSNFSNVELMHLNVRNASLRAYDGVKNTRYDGISVYDSKTRETYFRSNSPVLIEGTQKIINGKLWRKYYLTNPNK